VNQTRISVLRVPLDIINEDQIEQKAYQLLENGKKNQICLITFKDIMRAQFSKELLNCFSQSSLNIPITISARFAASWLKIEKPYVHNPFTFVIRLLGALEKYQKSVYILGSRKRNIQMSEKNLRTSFPGLQIVGRYAGSFSNQEENNVLTAIKKSSPSFLLTGKGLKGNNLWVFRNRHSFNPGLAMWGRSCFEVFSGKKSKPRNMNGYKWFSEIVLSFILPWRLLRFLLFFFLLTIQKIRS
jgi:N-acetylglucosaminyldiphosphoundecaprenol N-acetyl-beta-D-mannosaminyltransferase